MSGVSAFWLIWSSGCSPNNLSESGQLIYPEGIDQLSNRSFDSLEGPEQVFFLVWWLEGEVNNGGFHQFFFNSNGALAPETLDALHTIGAPNTGEILREAIDVAYAGSYPIDRSLHRRALLDSDAVMSRLEELDARFLAYEEDLTRLVNEYLGNKSK